MSNVNHGYSIKGLKTWETRDGGGYTCKLLLNGKAVAECEDGGYGGGVIVDFKDSNRREEFYAFLKTLPEQTFPEDMGGGSYSVCDDIFLGGMVDEERNNRRFKRLCKTKTLFSIQGDDPAEGFRTINKPYSPEIQTYLDNKYGTQVTEIVNKRFI